MVLLIFFSLHFFFFLLSLSWLGDSCVYAKGFVVDQTPPTPFFSFQLILCKNYGEVNCTISYKGQASKSLIKTINHQSNLILPLATTELSQFPPPSRWLLSQRLRTDFVRRRRAGAGTNSCCLLCECSCSLAKDFPWPCVPQNPCILCPICQNHWQAMEPAHSGSFLSAFAYISAF